MDTELAIDLDLYRWFTKRRILRAQRAIYRAELLRLDRQTVNFLYVDLSNAQCELAAASGLLAA